MQAENKANRRSLLSTLVSQIGNGSPNHHTVNFDYNKKSEILTISLNGPTLITEETIIINLTVSIYR